jgi:hypothetical protein
VLDRLDLIIMLTLRDDAESLSECLDRLMMDGVDTDLSTRE